RESHSKQKPIEGSNSPLPILISARTGLAGKDEALIDRVHSEDLDAFPKKTVKDALDYITSAEVSDSELPIAESIKKELVAAGKVIVINGKTAKLNDRLEEYLVTKEHELSDGSRRQYRELEIEISSVQQGGLYKLLK
ncbi:MAG: hypothetical protein AABX71_00900, partial [Nanoarchaeota archaeon]